MPQVRFRPLEDGDYPFVIGVVDAWWGGRPMADLLPRLFFQHFGDTSFAATTDDAEARLVGFLAGFVWSARAQVSSVRPVPCIRGRLRDLFRGTFAKGTRPHQPSEGQR